MNNPFLESPSILRKKWKSLRESLTEDLSDEEQLNTVAQWWAQCPVTTQWLDWDNESTWPDPWELITTKNLDYSAIALGIEYTLLLNGDGRWTGDRIHLWLANDIDRTMQHLMVVVDNKWMLNVNHAQVIKISNDFIVYARYRYENKKHIKI